MGSLLMPYLAARIMVEKHSSVAVAGISVRALLVLQLSVVIFFSLTEAPLPDPIPTPLNTPKRTRNGPETDPKRSQTEPNGPERSQTEPKWTEIKPPRVGRPGGFVGMGGVVREKENH